MVVRIFEISVVQCQEGMAEARTGDGGHMDLSLDIQYLMEVIDESSIYGFAVHDVALMNGWHGHSGKCTSRIPSGVDG